MLHNNLNICLASFRVSEWVSEFLCVGNSRVTYGGFGGCGETRPSRIGTLICLLVQLVVVNSKNHRENSWNSSSKRSTLKCSTSRRTVANCSELQRTAANCGQLQPTAANEASKMVDKNKSRQKTSNRENNDDSINDRTIRRAASLCVLSAQLTAI